MFKDLEIRGGKASDGGVLGGNMALGGGILIDGGQVTFSNAIVTANEADAASGASGVAGTGGKAGGPGGDGESASRRGHLPGERPSEPDQHDRSRQPGARRRRR